MAGGNDPRAQWIIPSFPKKNLKKIWGAGPVWRPKPKVGPPRPVKRPRPPKVHGGRQGPLFFIRNSAKQSSYWRDRRVKAYNPFKTKAFANRWG